METMRITVQSIVEQEGCYRARARAVARNAAIRLEVTFVVHPHAARREIWEQAKDEVLRYLDPA